MLAYSQNNSGQKPTTSMLLSTVPCTGSKFKVEEGFIAEEEARFQFSCIYKGQRHPVFSANDLPIGTSNRPARTFLNLHQKALRNLSQRLGWWIPNHQGCRVPNFKAQASRL